MILSSGREPVGAEKFPGERGSPFQGRGHSNLNVGAVPRSYADKITQRNKGQESIFEQSKVGVINESNILLRATGWREEVSSLFCGAST
jgi:hypothetical protein